MITDASPQGWGATLETDEDKLIGVAHGVWTEKQAKESNNSREINAIRLGLTSFAKILELQQIRAL
jgi:ribonuclease HI